MTNTPADTYTDLKAKLREMFQMDQADLDFGIYRIMNAKRDEISDYLDNDLQPQVKKILEDASLHDRADLEKQIKEAITAANELGIEPEDSPKYKTLLAQKSKPNDITALEREIFSDLYSFFARYYEGGDFLSLRRYKAGVYAIPYEGEEVKLHWANADQYYIKTSEYFANYAFTLGKKRVAFRLVSANTEQNNNKPAQGTHRRFVLADPPILPDADELVIAMEYRLFDAKTSQDDLWKAAIKTLCDMPELKSFGGLFDAKDPNQICKKDETPTSVLQYHLKKYTARNSFDYFIHKDLGGFLKRELDFFIKNEVLFLDNFIGGAQEDIIARLAKVRALKAIADKIITFLTGLEEFQKKLWLKKKFVVAADWCMTLDFVDEEFYKEIVANQAQHDAWVALFGIDGLTADLGGGVAYENPLSEEFLQANQNLVLDTALFDADFKHRLMASIDDLDERTDGLLIHGDNFHALNLLQEGYREQIKCIYIDPPYNTNASEIVYKNGYKHSSWCSLMANRLELGKNLLSDEGCQITAIDDTEFVLLAQICDEYFRDFERNTVVINHHPAGAGLEGTNISETHEYAIFCVPRNKKILHGRNKKDANSEIGFMRTGTAESNLRSGRPNSFYAVLVDPVSSEVMGAEPPPKDDNYSMDDTEQGFRRIYPRSGDGTERVWRRSYESFLNEIKEGGIICRNGKSIYLRTSNEGKYHPIFSNWTDSKYNAGAYGSKVLKNLMGENLFSYPKSIHTVGDCVGSATKHGENPVILDYFAGSGTTGHAVINLNREDGGKRKYILVEMGEYFETVTKPRIQKVIYAKDWKDGKPNPLGGTRTDASPPNSHCFKTIRLESYEDALNNLEIVPTATPIKQAILKDEQSNDGKDLREQYMLSYMLEMEAKISILNLDRFARPFDYTMNITTHTQTAETPVDLVETFNYLIGLRVIARGVIQQFNAQMEPDEHGRVKTERLKTKEKGEFSFQKLEGKTRDGKVVLVIWRTLTGDLERDSVALEKYLRKQDINPREHEFDVIYVNGDNTLPNIRKENEKWKVQLIEQVFFDKMFGGAR